MKKTKIIATIGPASNNKKILKQMFLDGVNVCRLNFSHGNFNDHSKIIKNIRDISSDIVDLIPELPSTLRKVINLINNDQLNLDNNLRKLEHIEKSIYKSTRRNYWMMAILIFSLFAIVITYLIHNNIFYQSIYWYLLALSIIIILLRPRKK